MSDFNSLGEARVRTSFNPSQTDVVAKIKQGSAELINMCESLREIGTQADKSYSELNRLVSLAQDAYEEAAMWAVKAATI
jgi:hypothetical protein